MSKETGWSRAEIRGLSWQEFRDLQTFFRYRDELAAFQQS